MSDQVAQTIQMAKAGSTTACYRVKWLGSQWWCEERSLDPLACVVRWVLSFLQCFGKGAIWCHGVKVYAAALSCCHKDFSDRPVLSIHWFLQKVMCRVGMDFKYVFQYNY